jgi:hypothetical protein
MSVVVGFVWFSANHQDQIALRQSIESVRESIRRKTAQLGLVAMTTADAWMHFAISVRHLAQNGPTPTSAMRRPRCSRMGSIA